MVSVAYKKDINAFRFGCMINFQWSFQYMKTLEQQKRCSFLWSMFTDDGNNSKRGIFVSYLNSWSDREKIHPEISKSGV